MFNLVSPLPPYALRAELFALGIVPANVLYYWAARISYRKGFPFPYLNIYMVRTFRNFHRVIREEQNPDRKRSYRLLAVAMYVCFAWCLFWFVAIVATFPMFSP